VSDFHAAVLADSISPDGVRLTTLETTFPRFILAELNTHRMLSRNSASSRAIPTEKIIERVRSNPFVPLTFNKRVKGMGVGEALDEAAANEARLWWLAARDDAVNAAEMLAQLNVDKSRANRLLEPFMWHTAIISATEWENFYALRDNEGAQPEFRLLAQKMRAAMDASEPQPLDYGWWHLPLVKDHELASLCDARKRGGADEEEMVQFTKMLSASRCARVSYDRQHDDEPVETTQQRAVRLRDSGHLSPFEHVARPMVNDGTHHPEDEFEGNFRGWVQMRKEIPYEDNAALLGSAA